MTEEGVKIVKNSGPRTPYRQVHTCDQYMAGVIKVDLPVTDRREIAVVE